MGFFHGDPHPGNLLKITEGEDAGKLCLLDFGLVAQVPKQDREIIVSAVVHLGAFALKTLRFYMAFSFFLRVFLMFYQVSGPSRGCFVGFLARIWRF